MLIQDELIAISADVVLTTWIPIAQGLKPAEKGGKPKQNPSFTVVQGFLKTRQRGKYLKTQIWFL